MNNSIFRKWFAPRASSLQTRLRRQTSRRRQLRPEVEALEDRLVPAGTYTGVVFQDFNYNGARDLTSSVPNAGTGTVATAVDRGLGGVTVTAYGPDGTVRGAATTAANGAYSLNATGTGPYRIEFTNLPAGFSSGPVGPDSATSVRFVPDGGAMNVNFGAVRPLDYFDNDPLLATTQQYFGAHDGQFANSPALITFPYSSGSAYSDTNEANYEDPTTHTISVPFSAIGATWGLGYDSTSRTIYAAALMKKHSGFGPGGPGAIYAINRDTGVATLFATLNAGPNLHNTSDYDTDNGNTSWDAVGKTGLGGLDVGPDGRVYVMNLFDRSLHVLNPDGTVAGVFQIPLNAPGATGANGADLQPFAVQFYQGKVYVGIVNSAESTQNAADLRAYVYEFDPATGTYGAAPVFQTALNYPRGQVFAGASADWAPWSPTFTTRFAAWVIYPQPELTGIAFDPEGNLVLGFRDRASDQGGWFSPGDDPNNPATLHTTGAAGDMLRAFINTPGDLTSGWTLENNARGPAGQGSLPQNNGQGPGNGEYYHDPYLGAHDETAVGAVLQVPGFPDVVGSFYDPVENAVAPITHSSGGFRWLNNASGQADKAYWIYRHNTPGQFGKGGGIGDLIVLGDPPPLELGNRVWLDDPNGIQDAGKPGIPGVTVQLFDSQGTLLDTAVTDANGEYIFSSDTRRTSTGSHRYGLPLLPGEDYTIIIPPGQAALGGMGPTALNQGGNDERDADGTPTGSNGLTLDVTAGATGVNNHSFDFGFHELYSLGNLVWFDGNNNGWVDAGETGLSGVEVRLYRAGGALVGTTTTNANGNYLFTDLPFGDYYVEITPPPGYLSSSGTGAGSAPISGPFEPATDPDDDINDGDDGTDVGGGVIRSGIVTLDNKDEPTDDGPEDDNSNGSDRDDDRRRNLSIDFGLYRLTPPPPPQVDLVLTKVVNNPVVANPRNRAKRSRLGSRVVFTLVVRNNGPDTATDVRVREPLPSGLEFVRIAGLTQGTFDPATGIWSVGTLAKGAEATLQIVVEIRRAGTITNTALAEAAQLELDPSNNTSSAVVRTLADISKRAFLASGRRRRLA